MDPRARAAWRILRRKRAGRRIRRGSLVAAAIVTGTAWFLLAQGRSPEDEGYLGPLPVYARTLKPAVKRILSIPEPSSAALVGVGAFALWLARKPKATSH
jgi:hypothetical protein